MTDNIQNTQLVEVADAPAIEGLSFRRLRGEADYPELVALRNGCNVYDKVEEQETLEEFRHNFSHLTNCDPDKDILIGEIDGKMVAYVRVFWNDIKDEGRAYYTFGVIHPGYRRRGIGTALLKHNQARIDAIAAGQEYDGKRFLDTWHAETQVGAATLLSKAGFKATRYFMEMKRNLSEPIADCPMPEGIETRPATKEQFRQIWDALDEAFRDHWGHEEKTETDYLRWSESPKRKPQLWMVGWDGDEVAGMVLNEVFEENNKIFGRKWGATDPICVRRPWRKRGLAKALITKSLHLFKDMGMEHAVLGVDTENPLGALKLYTGLGYETFRQETVMRKPLD